MLSIGQFARAARLSPKALRRYDELGLLTPARIDPESGYRWYELDQLERARLVASLRQLDVPLAEVAAILDLEPAAAADRITTLWASSEAEHAARRDLARYLIDRLNGRSPAMYDVTVRDMPSRTLLCLHRDVENTAGVWTLGKEFIGIIRSQPFERIEGRTGAFFLIYHAEVTDDSDGPVEFCQPIPDDQAEQIANQFPQLSLRTEPAHQEAYVPLGDTQANPPRWQLLSDTLHSWVAEHHREPSDLGVRITYLATPPRTATSAPDSDFAVPLQLVRL